MSKPVFLSEAMVTALQAAATERGALVGRQFVAGRIETISVMTLRALHIRKLVKLDIDPAVGRVRAFATESGKRMAPPLPKTPGDRQRPCPKCNAGRTASGKSCGNCSGTGMVVSIIRRTP